MEMVTSSPFPFPISRFRVFQLNPFRNPNFSFSYLLIFLVFALTVNSTTSYSVQSRFLRVPYSKHCGDVVPESPPRNLTNVVNLHLSNGIFSGGSEIFPHRPSSSHVRPAFVSLHVLKVYSTEDDDKVFKVEGQLVFLGPSNIGVSSSNSTHRRLLRLINYRSPRLPLRRRHATFKLHGYWSSTSGKLCMVGSGGGSLSSVDVVLKLDYPVHSGIFTSFVNGTLQSLDKEGALNYFKPIKILGVSLGRYSFSLIEREEELGAFSAYDKWSNVSLGFHLGQEMCSVIKTAGSIELEYLDDCDAVNCNVLGQGTGAIPSFVFFDEVECLENGRVRYLLKFLNSRPNGYRLPFYPSTMLVAEGTWNRKNNRLDLVACRINVTESISKVSVGDCSSRLSLRVPAAFSLRNRSIVVGQMWSNKRLDDSSYFGRVAFRSINNKRPQLDALRYEYGEYGNVGKSCAKKAKAKSKGRTYPGGYSSDMRFHMTMRDKKGHTAWGYSSPLSVDDKFYNPFGQRTVSSLVDGAQSNNSVLNVSYVISFERDTNLKLGGGNFDEISAEGIYDAKTGFLCMIGCRHLPSHNKTERNDSLDCEIVINAEYPPLNAKDGGNVKGTIESTRSKADPNYFDRLEFQSNSIYIHQAKESIWRMDLEIMMVLISNTLTCVFVGLQLFYVNKHPDALPFISVMMLIVLTLAHMIPLLLNFDAMFFSNHKRQTLFTETGGWLEVNEVLVRVITMIAFLLEFRLLQVTWSARIGDASLKHLWVSDKKVLYLSLPLYGGGGMIAWFFHLLRKPSQSQLHLRYDIAQGQISLWGEVKSYAGVVLDGFLLPQIAFNFFCDSSTKALTPSFYIGTTLVRLLPHAYDLYRAHSSVWSFSYIYANPRMDYYSTLWDIIISCSGVLFVVIIFLQQRFGGRCFLPQRYRGPSVYEKIPVTGT